MMFLKKLKRATKETSSTRETSCYMRNKNLFMEQGSPGKHQLRRNPKQGSAFQLHVYCILQLYRDSSIFLLKDTPILT